MRIVFWLLLVEGNLGLLDWVGIDIVHCRRIDCDAIRLSRREVGVGNHRVESDVDGVLHESELHRVPQSVGLDIEVYLCQVE